MTVRTYRTLFISDVHLGTKNAKAKELLDFLEKNSAPTLYLVGDIVDVWRIKRDANWPQLHNDVLQRFLRIVRRGTKTIYIPGNHDEALRAYCGGHFSGIDVACSAVHQTADGRKFVVMHGDEFDIVVRHAKWLALLGDWAYNVALWVNARFSWLRRRTGLKKWSLSAYLKQKVKQAVNFISAYESALVREARQQQADGIICGHIHHAAKREVGGILYINTGDWVESCTAVGENDDGSLEVIYWLERCLRDDAGNGRSGPSRASA